MILGFESDGWSRESLVELLEIVVRENVAYIRESRTNGRDLPRSAFDAGIRYCPDGVGGEIRIQAADALLDQGIGSCGSIAAYDAGMMRHRAELHGVHPAVAQGRYRIDAQQTHKGNRADYYHIQVWTPRGVLDSVARLEQVCPNPDLRGV